MNLTNYHSHSLYCDGRANMEDFIRFALSEGFTSYGFSSHAPLPFPTAWTMEWDCMDDYLAEFRRLKAKYAGQIELYIGLEIDYLNEESNPSVARFRELPLDYRIGSVHLLYNDKGEVVDVDVTADKFRKLVDEEFGGDLVRVVHLYYERLMRMVELGGFDIVGHADKMHYNAAAKSYLELGTFYPNERYFPVLLEKGIRVQVNSDSHYPERINNGRLQALAALQASGYHTVTEMYNNEWKDMPLIIYT